MMKIEPDKLLSALGKLNILQRYYKGLEILDSPKKLSEIGGMAAMNLGLPFLEAGKFVTKAVEDEGVVYYRNDAEIDNVMRAAKLIAEEM